MFRTLTLSAVALAAVTSFASAGNVADKIFIDLAMQDNDRAAVRALTKTDGIAFSSKGGSVASDIFIDLAAQDDDRAAVRALTGESVSGVPYSSKGSNISGLEVAYRHALENDDHQLALHLGKKLGY